MLSLRRWMVSVTVVGAAGIGAFGTRAEPRTDNLPAALSDADFWRIIVDFSEPDGYFRSDNLVSNEVTFQRPIPELLRGYDTSTVYLGVGPDQNFTYIVNLRPKLAFVVDIRRQNMVQHLMYKAIAELSPTRADFLSLLFTRKKPDVPEAAGPEELFAAYAEIPADSSIFRRNLRRIRDHLTRTHGFALTAEDTAGLEYVYTQFFTYGPDLTYSYGRSNFRGYGRSMPTYGELQVQDDGTGLHRGYLASEGNYRVLREMQRRNAIIPLTGDFAGPKAIRSVGGWIRSRGGGVSVIYTSNVEQYLFQSDSAWRNYYDNVGTLPLASTSNFIRAVFNMGMRGPGTVRSASLLCPVEELLSAYRTGRVQTYWDVIQLSR